MDFLAEVEEDSRAEVSQVGEDYLVGEEDSQVEEDSLAEASLAEEDFLVEVDSEVEDFLVAADLAEDAVLEQSYM